MDKTLYSCVSIATRQLFLLLWLYIIDRLVCLNYVTVSYDSAMMSLGQQKCVCVCKCNDIIMLDNLRKCEPVSTLNTHPLCFPSLYLLVWSPFSFVCATLTRNLSVPVPPLPFYCFICTPSTCLPPSLSLPHFSLLHVFVVFMEC